MHKKKILETHKYESTDKKLRKRNIFLILIQIQNRTKLTTTQIERKNIPTRYERMKNWYTQATGDSRDLRDVVCQNPKRRTIRSRDVNGAGRVRVVAPPYPTR